MKALIIEDEKPAARRLNRMLNSIGVNPVAMLHSVEEAVNWFHQNQHPDLLFLDIQLSDGLSFEIFDEVDIKSAIIFTTAYDEYALKAFKLNSIDYLLKPIDADELENAIEKYKELNTKSENPSIDLEQLKSLISPGDRTFKKRFTVKIGQHLKMIPVALIECIYSENKSSYLFSSKNRSYLIDDTLEIIEDKLNPEEFYRVNRKFIIKISAIKEIVAYTNSRLKIRLNTYADSEIIVSRERVKDFKNWLD